MSARWLSAGGTCGAVKLNPERGRLALRRTFAQTGFSESCGYLRARVRFHDAFGDEGAADSVHWFGVATRFGCCAVGIAPGLDDCYSFLNGSCPDGAPGHYHGWQRSVAQRRAGWHEFEIIIGSDHVQVLVDGERVFSGQPDTTRA